jgi:predicted TIM-barrel fold metal-dependent hydrolase
MSSPVELPTRIVDAHHHLWDLNAINYPWLMAKGEPRFFGDPTQIQKDYLVDDFRCDHADLSIVKSVHIQVGVAAEDALLETRWLQCQNEAYSWPSAIVAFSDLTAVDIADQLEAHAQSLAFRGIRQIVGRSAEEDATTGTGSLLADPRFLEGLIELSDRGLSFDLQLLPTQMSAAASLLEKLPNLKVALCHAGSLSRQEEFNIWKEGIERFAALPNVICKMSGFGMFDRKWTTNSTKVKFDVVADTFGPKRIAFGSNFPVEKLASGYVSVWTRFSELTSDFSNVDRAMMFAGTAEGFYRI